MRFAYELEGVVSEKWHQAKQLGIEDAVCISGPGEAFPYWDYLQFAQLKKKFDDFGLRMVVLEALLPFDSIRFGTADSDRDTEIVLQVIRNMGALGVPIMCYNWMARIGWLRTSFMTPTRGGAFATSYDHEILKKAPIPDKPIITKERLWETLEKFLKKAVPVAEKAGVRLAMHPDDPPLSPILGIERIMTSVEAFERVLSIVDSEANGLTFCQGNFSLMPGDLVQNIHRMAKTGRMYFVHFRNLIGNVEKFSETFHDAGQVDMFEAMKAYRESGFNGFMRCDHVPSMAGDGSSSHPGYEALGKLFAVGYMKGLLTGVDAMLAERKK